MSSINGIDPGPIDEPSIDRGKTRDVRQRVAAMCIVDDVSFLGYDDGRLS